MAKSRIATVIPPSLVPLMRSPDDVTGPINLCNPGEFTIRELAELVIDMTGSRSRSAA